MRLVLAPSPSSSSWQPYLAALSWSYSKGERAGWCRSSVTRAGSADLGPRAGARRMPGTAPEKFEFTVRDGAVAAQITRQMGKRVSLHSRTEGGPADQLLHETRYFVTGVIAAEESRSRPAWWCPRRRPRPLRADDFHGRVCPGSPPLPRQRLSRLVGWVVHVTAFIGGSIDPPPRRLGLNARALLDRRYFWRAPGPEE